MEWHPLSKRYRMMTQAEYAVLLADIKANGLLEPIVLLDGQILDGRNRYKACLEAGVEPRFIDYTGPLKPKAFVDAKNDARRHLSLEERLKDVRDKLIEEPGKSDRAIAEETQTHRATVKKEREKLEESGAIPQTEARTGKDKKTRQVPDEKNSTGTNVPVETERPAGQVSERKRHTQKKDPLKDETGADVPDHLRDVFGDPWLRDLKEIIDGMSGQISSARVSGSLRGKSQAYSSFLKAGEILIALSDADKLLDLAESMIRAGTPYAVHQACNGIGCDDCRKAGWVPLWRHKELEGGA